MDLVYFLIVSIISNIIFTIIFLALNKSILGLFVPLQKLVYEIKKKTFLDYYSYVFHYSYARL